MTDVFISYSRRDKVFTQKLVDALQAADREVWADWASIPAASDWDAEIKEGIEKTNTVLFLLSPEWIKSNECRKEMDHAIKMGKRMVPILHIMPAEGQEVPPELAKLNWVYMREGDDFDKTFETLQSAMDTDLDWIKTHTRIQVRALEWEKKNRSASFALRGEDLTEGEQFIAGRANKNPVPTQLQSEYVLASRKDATRRQRITLSGVTVALIISIALGIFAFNQASVSRAGELAAQSNEMHDKDFQVSTLLAIEAFHEAKTDRSKKTILDVTNDYPYLIRILKGYSLAAFSPDGKIVAALRNDNSIILSDLATGNPISSVKVAPETLIYSMVFSHNGKILALINYDNTILLYNLETEELVGQLTINSLYQEIEFNPSDNMLASASASTIVLWDLSLALESKEGSPPENFLVGNQGVITAFTFSPDGNTLAIVNINSDANSNMPDTASIILWDVARKKIISQSFIGNSAPEDLAFTESGDQIVLVNPDNTASIWSVSKRAIINQFSISPDSINDNNSSPIYIKLVSSDGNYVLTGAPDPNCAISCQSIDFRLWETTNGNALLFLSDNRLGGDKTVSPNRKNIASNGLTDDIIYLWDVIADQQVVYSDIQAAIEKSCQRAGRNFTHEEWTQYFPNEKYRKTCPQWDLEPEPTPTTTP